MCGIITSVTKVPSLDNVKKIKAQYEEQKNRGTEGFGFVAVKNGQVIWIRSKKEKDIMTQLDTLGETSLIMFHHRVPTCNYNTPKANHPFYITSKKNLRGKYFIVHNGHIDNHQSLRDEHEKEGYKYKSEVSWGFGGDTTYSAHTDSEALGIEMAKFIEGRQSRIKARGRAAIFMLELDHKDNPTKFYYFRETNPISWYRNQKSMFFASEAKGIELPEKKLYCLDLSTWEVLTKDAHLSTFDERGLKDITPPSPFMLLEKSPIRVPMCDVGVMQENPNNVVVIPHPVIRHEKGFSKLFENYADHPSALSMSIRTHRSIEEAITKAEEKLYSAQSDLFEFINVYGDDPNNENLVALDSDVKKHQGVVDMLKRQLAAVELGHGKLATRNAL